MSVTRTLVYVAHDRVDVTIEVFLEDLYLFHNLRPDETDYLDTATIRRGMELHREFVATRFLIQDAEGLIRQSDNPPKVTADVPDDGVSLAELMAHKLTFEMQYSFDAPPEFLTFEQRFTDADGVLPSEMQLQVRPQNADETISKALVPHSPETIRFDWTSPPLSKDASQQERERWATQQQEATLGITSYSSVYSFLYIEDHEVRHEILIPLLTLEQSLPLDREQTDFLTVSEQDTFRPLIEKFFALGNPVEVDGVRPAPIVERCDFYGVDFLDLAQLTERKPVAMSSARVGIILTYPLVAAPRNIRLTWDRFNKALWTINMVVFSEDADFRKTLSRIGSNNVFEWNSPNDSSVTQERVPAPVVAELPKLPTIRLPVLTLILLATVLASVLRLYRGLFSRTAMWITMCLMCGAAVVWGFDAGSLTMRWGSPQEISDDEARQVVTKLLSNVYDAFRFRGEDEVYDALAVSTSGDLLQDLYLQIQQSLRMTEQGGAVARVKQVDVIETDRKAVIPKGDSPPSGYAFTCLCRWNISGTVEHWGHIHERINQFQASFLAEPVPVRQKTATSSMRYWKLTGMNIVDSKRVHFETRLRNLTSSR
ncbi:MAG: hypothetical protein MK102_14980 [Fuerstiella sp.]|nr:hypothetical protein [Fuerstiella sp.]